MFPTNRAKYQFYYSIKLASNFDVSPKESRHKAVS